MSKTNTNSKQIAAFRRTVWSYYRAHGRHDLPWRKTTDSYRILVSEMMLQQTQVPRVLSKYPSFIKKFPTAKSLARAPLSDVLKEWSGLGYNRRAKYLHDCAKIIAKSHIHTSPTVVVDVCKGIGPYTRAAVRAFAYNEPVAMLETNIRTALIHTFYQGPSLGKVGDKELMGLMAKIIDGQRRPREFYWALMDYGAHLKASGVSNNARSKHYTKQSRFEGSLRQVRGKILRELQKGPLSMNAVRCHLTASERNVREALEGLERDGLIRREKGKWRIA